MKTLLLIFFIGFVMFISSGCANYRIKPEEFDSVKLGMTTTEVKDILGEPDIITRTVDSDTNFHYYVKKSLFGTESAVVNFDKLGRVSFTFFGNPD
jgi:outer membrane protein assembly factor BamE (lipoprotein component of BamABCDE complex)